MWLYGRELFIVSHHPAKFGGHRHCGSGDVNIPANTVIFFQMQDIRDCIYLLTSAITILSKVQSMSCATRVSNNNLTNNFLGKLF